MKITANISELRQFRWADPTLTWGLAPTMGYLHEGHLSLVRRAKAENERTAVTIFVNPTQFAPTEDLTTYPRNLQHDLTLLQAEGVDLVFTPNNETMYPSSFQTRVTVTDVSRPLEGTSRPTHFQGVATVVAKLFNLIQPTRAYFGQKDAQQAVVLKQMVRDLNFNLAIVVCPIVREADGLALSSRNANLSPAERQAATILNRALKTAHKAYQNGERHGRPLCQIIQDIINTEPLARLDYATVADPNTLQELDEIQGDVLLATAVFIGQTRLIDNVLITDE
ncbi:MAG: pantoate--beta-alanine ligase [Chloroflexi bacterium]|nr:pantoate--beta-alanine ligase [Chloroflexota bacterium]